MTAKEQSQLKSLQWAQRTATSREVERCMELELKARSVARS